MQVHRVARVDFNHASVNLGSTIPELSGLVCGAEIDFDAKDFILPSFNQYRRTAKLYYFAARSHI